MDVPQKDARAPAIFGTTFRNEVGRVTDMRIAGNARTATLTTIIASALATLLSGCDSQQWEQLPSKVSTQADELASMKRQMAVLENRVSTLEQAIQAQQKSVGNWTLWQVNEAVNAGYPRAFSAYPSKTECLAAASEWTFPGGEAVSDDPRIFQFKGYRIVLECLPVGTTPYAH